MWKTTLGVEDLSTSRTADNVERVKQMVRGDRQLTVRMIADELEINRDSVWKIITEDLGMRKICAKMVPKASGRWPEGAACMEVFQDILEHLQTKPDLLQRVITGDESWIFKYDSETFSSQYPSSLEAKESKTVEVQNQAHVDHILWH